jgi:hypothetical protein
VNVEPFRSLDPVDRDIRIDKRFDKTAAKQKAPTLIRLELPLNPGPPAGISF